jgi:DUF1365 family protein
MGGLPPPRPERAPLALLGSGEVQHTRLRPAVHRFRYPTYFLMLPLRALQADPSGWGRIARNRWGWVSFYDRDHGLGAASALDWIEHLLNEEGIQDADGEVWLHCYPRVWGYTFKPVSFWYCHRKDGSLAAVVAEVNNTFGERHAYLLQGPELKWGATVEAQKVFHVSPFCAVSGRYQFRFLRTQGASERTVVRIEHHDGQGPLILTSVSGRLAPATRRALRQALWSMPLLTLGVVWKIHWQALQLWRKHVPFFRKPAPPQAFVSR